MHRAVVAAVIVQVVFLLAMVRQRLAGHLASRDAATVSERRQKQGIDRRPLLENIQHLPGALIDRLAAVTPVFRKSLRFCMRSPNQKL